MKNTVLYIFWGCLYALCVGLGTVENPAGFGKVLLVLTSLIFFLPPGYLLYDGIQNRRKKQVVVIRIISIVSLSLTLVLLVANFLSVGASAAAGRRLYELLNLSLFLWACLLWGSFKKKK